MSALKAMSCIRLTLLKPGIKHTYGYILGFDDSLSRTLISYKLGL